MYNVHEKLVGQTLDMKAGGSNQRAANYVGEAVAPIMEG